MERKRELQDEPSASTTPPEVPPKRMKEDTERKRPFLDEPSTSEEDAASLDTTAKRLKKHQDLSDSELEFQDSDLVATEDERYKDLHEAVENGHIELVRHLLQSHSEEQYFSYDDTSALYLAFSCEQYEIISYLILKGAKIHDSEVYDLYSLDIDLTRVNYLLLDYNKKSEKSCIFQLISWSQSPQGLDGDRLTAIMSMYEEFFKSEIMKLLMMVLESEAFDVVYDFSSEDVNRIYRLYKEECEIYGLTVSNSKEIFVGAKNLLSGDPQERYKVYGVVAEELCHLALTTLFENGAKPYREEDTKLNQEFQDTVLAVKSVLDRSCHVVSVIQDVFTNYSGNQWECELIARVPHVIGIYGEECARRIFQESPQLSRILSFYEQHVLPKCKTYTDPSLNTKAHRMMERLMKKNNFISFKEKQIPPLKEGFPSFREYLVHEEGFSVVTTNCTKLCTLHIYHELKREYQDLLEKKCLFFTRKCFEMKRDEIVDILKGKVFEYLILVMDKKVLNLQRFHSEYLDDFEDFITKGLKIVLISASQSLDQKFKFENAVNYNWNNLREEYKTIHEAIEYIFKGETEVTCVQKEEFPKVFSEEDIIGIISSEIIEVDDGTDLFSQGYILENYIDREFQVMTVDKKIFKNVPPNNSIFLSGFSRREFQELLIDENLVQWFHESNDYIQDDKPIFITNDRKAMTFEDFARKNTRKTSTWLHYDENEFILRNSNSYGDIISKYVKQRILNEKQMLNFLKRKRIVIISDNAGYGKSTVVSNLIRYLKANIYKSWIWRVNLNKYSTNEKDPLSLAHIDPDSDDEEVFEQLFVMLGMENGLKEHLFRILSRYGNCFLFFDGFDEIPLKYKNKALKLLSTVRDKTNVNMIITTRRHHQQELEQLLNAYSHQLVPFSRKDQVRYLEKLWKSKLKYPNGEASTSQKDKKAIERKIKNIIRELKKERTKLDPDYQELILGFEKIELTNGMYLVRSDIDMLKFTALAEGILYRTSLDENTLEMMGIPLHLYMIGIIHYTGNFNVELKSDVFHLYSQFIEQKILIYLEEKQGLWHEGSLKDEKLVEMRKDVYRIHTELADQLIDEGKVPVATKVDEKDLKLCSALGIVFIHDGGVHFLHQTFGEYFKAESLRQNLQKEVLVEVLFEDKYNVVKRFLSSALVKESFQNLSKDFFEDVAFLVTIMERIVDKKPVKQMIKLGRRVSCMYTFDSEIVFCFQIVKKLLETFEKIAHKGSGNELVDVIHNLIIKRTKLGNRDSYHIGIGGCLTGCMLKRLLAINFNVHYFTLLTFVRYTENPQEVIDILDECISIKSDQCGRRNREFEEKNVKAKLLLELISLEDGDGEGLLPYALWNERSDIFAYFLKFYIDGLGKEQFTEAIVQSNEYRNHLKRFIKNVHPDRMCSSLKALHSIFGNETEILFDDDSKFRVIYRAVKCDRNEESSNSFEKVISLFQECFGIKKLEELFLSRDSDGDYLTHKLMFKSPNRNFMKNFDLIKNVLDDKDKIKQFLESVGRYIKSVIHLAAYRDVCLRALLQICNDHLEKDEIKQLLLITDENGDNVIHLLFWYNSSDVLMKNLKLVKEVIGENEWFKNTLKRKDRYLRNIFHLAAKKDMYLKELLQIYHAHLGKDEIKDMLLATDDINNNVMHFLFRSNSSETLIKNLNLVKDVLDDDERLVQLLKSKGEDSRNIYHWAAYRDIYLRELLLFCIAHFKKEDIKQMLISSDNYADNVFYFLVLSNSPKTLMKNLKDIKEVLDDDEWFKEFIKSKNKYLMNIFHLAAYKDMHLNELLQIFNVHFKEDDIREMLISTDKYSDNVIHFLFENNSSEMLMKNLKLTKEVLSDDLKLKQLLKSRGQNSWNIFHFAARNSKEINISFVTLYLSENEIADLLMERDKDGQTCLHYAATYIRNFPVFLDYAEGILEFDRSRFKELILGKNNCGNTFLHSLAKTSFTDNVIDSVNKIFGSLREKLSDEIFKVLLRAKNEKGQIFLQIDSKIRDGIMKCCKEIVEKDFFVEFLEIE